ncbi:50S ribosomal protein L23 [Candidatus Nesciobacter abundans]|uniref:50S ribosomal protein L23 n=1 Tax=Candidatus Nesciobacter abundans TaxID=2601668 RepID=A0A5C0UH68_9PROT|nr:50S ribosomal protein L23 [Candidatus Nesciobacter abundans]QEK38903.1 50S ribosomal protein L23 [Candidatus Nesciobacter abundans]
MSDNNNLNEKALDLSFFKFKGVFSSEKSSFLSRTSSYIVLKMIPSTTKVEMKVIFESLFGFSPQKIKSTNYKGKSKVFKGTKGTRKAWKKFFVKIDKENMKKFVEGVE